MFPGWQGANQDSLSGPARGRESAAPRFLRAQMPATTLTETAAMAQLISSRGTKAGCGNAVVGPLISGNLPVRRKG